jgi:hypothetical protein
MSRHRILKLVCAVFAAALACQAQPLFACAACFGKSDSPLAAAMNWGIASLLVVVVFVLGSVASFFIFLAKKAASVQAVPPRDKMIESTQKA